jgi:hypothetical protein
MHSSLKERISTMKRTIIAVLFASLSVPVLAADIGAPYEQTVQDMQLPNVQDPVVNDQASSGATFFGVPETAPYERWQRDMALPNVKDPVVTPSQQVAGPAQPMDPRQATGDSSEATGPWANDPNFIAPPQ